MTQHPFYRLGEHKPVAPYSPVAVGSPALWGLVGQNSQWQAAMRLYDQDKLEGAYELVEELGDGQMGTALPFLRQLEGELDLRTRGRREVVNDWLTVEFLPEELGEDISLVSESASALRERQHSRFSWSGSEPVLLALLSQQVDADWATGRFGYCVQKTDYFKICIPHHALSSKERFDAVFTHEYSHVMSLSASKGRISKWLGEGFSVHASDDHSQESWNWFQAHPDQWLLPHQLESQFGPGTDLGSQGKWLAYQQAGWITRYLAGLRGEASLMQFITDLGDDSFWRNMKILALGQTRESEAIGHFYGISEGEIFEAARP
jgi:hypothetical protein